MTGPFLDESNDTNSDIQGHGPYHVSWVKQCAKQFIRIISFSHHNDYALGIITGPVLRMIKLTHT